MFAESLNDGEKVLEIGCGDGKNLAFFTSYASLSCAGIDPSAMAIEKGKELHPYFDLQVGTADSLPFADQTFDMVLFGFCLYLADREDLVKIVFEADRVLKNDAKLGILDFAPPYPIKKDYSHLEGVKTFKLDYASLFLSFPHYSLENTVSMSHEGPGFHADPDERISGVLLHKNIEQGYSSNV